MGDEVRVSLRWYVDESMIAIGKALAAVRPDLIYPGHPLSPVSRGTNDEDWLPIVGQNGWGVLMRDKRIRYRQPERQQLLDHGVRAFCLTGSGNQSKWEMLRLLVRHWDQMEDAMQLDGPFLYAVTTTGLRRIAT